MFSLGKDECDQDGLNAKSIERSKDLVRVLLILTRHEDNIPLNPFTAGGRDASEILDKEILAHDEVPNLVG